jgi:hypothetical protein
VSNIDLKTFDFLSILTALVVLLYVGASIYAFAQGQSTWQDFSGAVGPMAGMLLGYWVKGRQ